MDVVKTELNQRIENAIVHNPHFSHRRMYLKMRGGEVVLEGKVETFFQKQMAQEALKLVEGVEHVVNHLDVDY